METGVAQESGLDCQEAHGSVEDNHVSGAVIVGNALEYLPELHRSSEPEQIPQKGRYNLRKSIAWDSAFFTSAGVLDPEEISSMINSVDKPNKHLLSGIQEEVTGSTESISTLDDDALTLETIEDDLFVDIRASIQRSSRKMSKLTSPSSKTESKEKDFAVNSGLKEKNSTSQNKNQKSSAKKTSIIQPFRMPRSHPKDNAGKLGPGKQIKQGSAHSQVAQNKSVGKSFEKNPVPPKVPKSSISSSIPRALTTTKREPTVAAHIKSECGSPKLAVASGEAIQKPKVSAVGGVRRQIPKPAVSSKSSQLNSLSSNSVHSVRSSTSTDSSTNMPSSSHSKSAAVSSKRNLGKSDNCRTRSSGSFPKTPSRATLRPKQPSPALSTYLMSTKTSSVSPASSISEWSVVSSSSTSLVNNTSGISNNGADRFMDGDKILDKRSCFAGRTGYGLKGQGTTSNNSKRPPMQTGVTQTSMKPSGLRMPSPKIGFFDGVKSSARTPLMLPQSSGFPKNGIATSSSTSSMKSESDNISSATMIVSSSGKVGSLKRTSPSLSLAVEKLVHTEDLSKLAMDADEITGSKHISIASFDWSNGSGSEYIDLTGDNSLINQNILEKITPKKNTVSACSTFGTSDVKSETANIFPCLTPGNRDASRESFQMIEKFRAEGGVKQNVDADTSDIITEKINKNMIGEDPSKASFESEYIDHAGDSSLVSHDILEKDCPIICNSTTDDKIHVKYEGFEEMVNADTSSIVQECIHTKTGSKDMSSEAYFEWNNASGLEYTDNTVDATRTSRTNTVKGLKRDDSDAELSCYGSGLDILSDGSECRLYFPSTGAESASLRTPFAPKNFATTTEESIGVSKEMGTHQYTVPDKAGLMIQLSEQKEN